MRQLLTATALGLGVVLSAGAIPAAAQFAGLPGGYRGPAGVRGLGSPVYSPYLNLLRQGNPFFANYYGLVRPELDWRSSVQALEAQVVANQQGITNLETQIPFVTGHPIQFFNRSHYFFYTGILGPTTRGATTSQRPQQQPGQLPTGKGTQAPTTRK
jgi:hypothetical protein